MSAPQQAAQGIDIVIGVLGILIAGVVVYPVDQA
jgi:hypothetical protein